MAFVVNRCLIGVAGPDLIVAGPAEDSDRRPVLEFGVTCPFPGVLFRELLSGPVRL
jgi:hypothetical protein